MKKKSLVLVVLVLLIQTSVLALDTLYLNVPQFLRARLQFNNQAPIIGSGRIAVSGSKWVLKINNPTGIKITLSNMEAAANSVILDGGNNTFDIVNNLLSAKNFRLDRNVRISVEDPAGGGIRRFDIEIGSSEPGMVNN